MFTEQPYYEAKVFLKSYNDAIASLREAAEQKAQVEFQEHVLQSLATARTRQEMQEMVKQCQDQILGNQSRPSFSNFQSMYLSLQKSHVFAKYFKGFEEFNGSFKGFQQIVMEGLKKMKSDVK